MSRGRPLNPHARDKGLAYRWRTSFRFRQEVYAFAFLGCCIYATFGLPDLLRSFVRRASGFSGAGSTAWSPRANGHEAPGSSEVLAGASADVDPPLTPRGKAASAPRVLPKFTAEMLGEDGPSGADNNGTRPRREKVKKPPRPLTPTTPIDDLPPLQGNPRELPDTMTMDDLLVHKGNAARQGFKDLRPLGLPPNRMAAMGNFKGKTCAVVGNSGNMLEGALGGAVQAHDVVVRINAAPTAGFGADLGNRTDMRALSKSFTHRYALGSKEAVTDVAALPLEWGSTLLLAVLRADEYNDLVDALQEKWRRADVELLLAGNKVVTLVKKAIGDYRRHLGEESFVLSTRGTVPSVGFLTTYLLMLACRSVTAYGFGLADSHGRSTRFHYWDAAEGKGKQRLNLAKTAIDVEFALLRTLDSKGYISLCLGEGPGCQLQTADAEASPVDEDPPEDAEVEEAEIDEGAENGGAGGPGTVASSTGAGSGKGNIDEGGNEDNEEEEEGASRARSRPATKGEQEPEGDGGWSAALAGDNDQTPMDVDEEEEQ